MTKRGEVSATMAAALDMATQHGGKLVRHQGGYWTYENCPRSRGIPDEYFGTTTINGLLARERMKATLFVESRKRGTRFPIMVEVVAP